MKARLKSGEYEPLVLLYVTSLKKIAKGPELKR